MVILLGRFFAHKDRPQQVFPPYGDILANMDKKPPDFLLEDHHECQRSHTDEAAENLGEQVHVELLDEQENDIDKPETDEDINGDGAPYQAVNIIQDYRHQEDVDNI